MQEARLEQKLAMAQAFARANRFDREEGAMGKVRVGIIASGKAWLDLKEALVLLGIEPATHGIALRKIALVWPLEPEGLRAFATRCDRLVFVEEKRAVIEEQARHLLYNLPGRPEILGKTDIAGQSLFPALGELGPLTVARALVRVLPRKIVAPLPALSSRHVLPPAPSLKREPYFCAGCPHATSTRLPEGSRATTGIGCHMMMIDVPGRMTSTFTQMGGEGVSWLGLAPFSEENHIFVNMGDGTYFHSGLLAIRAAVSAKVNATYKILFNDAVAMTGGQAHDGPLNVPALAAQLLAEGLARVAVVAEEPAHLRGKLPDGVSLDHRDRLTAIQMELREQPGVSALIYDQVCAAEKRRRRKIGTFALPTERVVINEAVCEGCGDCAVQSGCIALEPADTPQGLKRRINQSSCNVDLSCLKGFCPSFVTLPGATLRQASVVAMPDTSGLATPKLPACGLTTFNIVLAGIGGSGVITVAEMLSRAAVLDGLSMAGLDQTGLAQKNGSVVCHLRLATSAERLHASRVPEASADLLLGFDIVVSGGAKVLPLTAHDRTRIVCDSHLSPTAEIVRSGGAAPDAAAQLSRLKQMVAEGAVITSDATRIAYSKLGDTMAANLVLVGHAWQSGLLPLRLSALEAALEQGKSAEFNRAAFAWGRLAAANPGLFDPPPELRPQTLDEVIAAGETHMTAWGGARAARDWRTLVDLARTAETGMGDAFSRAVAATGLRLMAYKDEYEVARLHRLTSFRKELDQTFVLDGRPRFHLAPPFLSWRRDGRTGRPAKIAMGRIADWSFALLVRLRSLRATPFDLFGRTHERQAERRLSRDFAALVTRLSAELSTENHFEAIRIVSLGQHVRGFGPVKAAAMVRYEEQLTQALKNF
jgi:indolepyruvate ferredoxin oxidoreductase